MAGRQLVIQAKDYHRVLGIRKGASRKEIQEAYRRLALAYHPDKNKDAGAEERFKEINEAYAILSGKEKPQPETKMQQRMGEEEAWASRVVWVWKNIEEERHNNMYR
jgi:DnaJ-class molecular chaperone